MPSSRLTDSLPARPAFESKYACGYFSHGLPVPVLLTLTTGFFEPRYTTFIFFSVPSSHTVFMVCA